jgi:hypothetical protein
VPHLMRPPIPVIIMSLLWSTAAGLEAIIWYLERDIFYLIVAIIVALLTIGILKGYRWVYWLNVSACSIALGIGILQIEIPEWAPRSTFGVVISRAAVALVMICIHQIKSSQAWFCIEPTKKHRMVFWLAVGMLTIVGQHLLPTIRSLRG